MSMQLAQVSPTIVESPFLLAEEAAAFLKVSKAWLAQLRVEGGGPPYIKLGKCITYEIPDLIEFGRRHKRKSTSDLG